MALRTPKTVLVAIDDSEHSMYALQWALNTLLMGCSSDPERTETGDKIILIHVKHSSISYAGPYPGYVLPTDVVSGIDRSRDREIARFMHEAAKNCEENNVRFENQVVVGDAREAICDVAEELKVDFLVMGSHGYGAVKRVVLGSVSDHCVHHAKCPVVIVKKPHHAQD